jgi:hypothetical protein
MPEWLVGIFVGIAASSIFEVLKHHFLKIYHPRPARVVYVRVLPTRTQRLTKYLRIVWKNEPGSAQRKFFYGWLWRLPVIVLLATPAYTWGWHGTQDSPFLQYPIPSWMP